MDKVSKLKSTVIYHRIEADVSVFVKENLSKWRVYPSGEKTIHDSVWGSVEYSEWEAQLIDSPLLQRLREIHQVGLALLTYPAARHSRFEHSLGVASAIKKMCDRINANREQPPIGPATRNCLILAALLHDVGHCFYSHLSESVYGELPDFLELRQSFRQIMGKNPQPHEILSFIIVNSAAFQHFFFEKVNYPGKETVRDTLFADVGCMITGVNIVRNGRIRSFQTAMLNGFFDADKLDYIRRDAMTAGLALQYDIERLFTKLRIHPIADPESGLVEDRLLLNANSSTAIEELTFCKIMLFSHVYRHQKVLVTEAIIKDCAEGLQRLKVLPNISDFLKYTDEDFRNLTDLQKDRNPFPEYVDSLNLKELVERVRLRNLPKRCLEVTRRDLEKITQKAPLGNRNKNDASSAGVSPGCGDGSGKSLVDSIPSMTYSRLLELRKELFLLISEDYKEKERPVNFSLFDIYILFPPETNYGSAKEAVILAKDEKTVMTIEECIHLDDWALHLNASKWRGYVYVTERIDRNIAHAAAARLLLGTES
ncbi:MAG: HD domain-containing protein [Lachnospiraceae bacterium]|nr:HD domain-containing protein [Lachnospiraceae bacterium]